MGDSRLSLTMPRGWKWMVPVELGIGALAALLWRKHPVLGFLGASGIAGSISSAAAGNSTWKMAAMQSAGQVAAVASGLAVPTHPALAYVGAKVLGDLLIGNIKIGGNEKKQPHELIPVDQTHALAANADSKVAA